MAASKARTSTKQKQDAFQTVTRPELLVDGNDDAFRALVHSSLAFASRLMAVRDGYAKAIGLAGPQYTILMSIRYLQQVGDVHVKTIAEHLSLSGTFVTTEVNRLVDKKLVVKKRDPQDARRVRLTTSELGQERLRKLAPMQRQINDVHFGTLTRSEFDALREIMPKLVSSTDEAVSLIRHLARSNGSDD